MYMNIEAMMIAECLERERRISEVARLAVLGVGETSLCCSWPWLRRLVPFLCCHPTAHASSSPASPHRRMHLRHHPAPAGGGDRRDETARRLRRARRHQHTPHHRAVHRWRASHR
jgi:hypothetical protein